MPKKLLVVLYALPYSWFWLQAWYLVFDPAVRRLLDIDKGMAFMLGIGLVLLFLLIPLLLAGCTANMLSWRHFGLLRCIDMLLYAVLVGFDSFEMQLLVPIALVLILLQTVVRFCYYNS